jgi:hypothetical protein
MTTAEAGPQAGSTPAAPDLGEGQPTAPLEDLPREPRPRKQASHWSSEEEEEREYRPRSRRSRARSAVMPPAIALMVLGGVYICISLGMLGLRIFNLSHAMAIAPQGQGDPAFAAGYKFGVYGALVFEVVGVILGAVIILGAIQMKNVGNFGLAMTASILAMVPCHYCCLVGIPLGIWSVITLNQEDVKSAFG